MKYLLILVLALYVSCTHSMMVNNLGDFNKIWKGTAKIAKIDSSGTGSNKVYIIEYRVPR